MNSSCRHYKQYTSVRKGSFFEGFIVSFVFILKFLVKLLSVEQQYTVLNDFGNRKNTAIRVIQAFYTLIKEPDYSSDKLGGIGTIVQIDETMLNYKVKSHRGRSPLNKTDSLCIVEVSGSITRAFACVIENKRAETLIPIIEKQVCPGSIIWTTQDLWGFERKI